MAANSKTRKANRHSDVLRVAILMNGLSDYFAQYLVKNPIGRCRAYAVASAVAFMLKVLYYVPDKRQLHVWRIGDVESAETFVVPQFYRLECEYREFYSSFAAEYLYVVLFGGFVGDKAPGTGTGYPCLEFETCADSIFSLVQPSSVCCVPLGIEYASEHILQKVYLVWSQVIEISASCYVGYHSPWEVVTVVVEVAWWNGKPYLYIEDFAYSWKKLLDLVKIWQITAIVCNKAWYSCFA